MNTEQNKTELNIKEGTLSPSPCNFWQQKRERERWNTWVWLSSPTGDGCTTVEDLEGFIVGSERWKRELRVAMGWCKGGEKTGFWYRDGNENVGSETSKKQAFYLF